MIDMTDQLDADLGQVIAAVFGLDPAQVDRTASRDTVPGWDSLGQIGLVLALEERFGVSIDVARIAELTSFAAAREVVAALTAPSS